MEHQGKVKTACSLLSLAPPPPGAGPSLRWNRRARGVQDAGRQAKELDKLLKARKRADKIGPDSSE